MTIIKDDSNKILAQYAYDELSNKTLLTLGNGTAVEYEYDLADRLKKLTNEVNDVNIVFEYANYDKVGNRLGVTAWQPLKCVLPGRGHLSKGVKLCHFC